jgi:hypothetical protein
MPNHSAVKFGNKYGMKEWDRKKKDINLKG